MNKKEKADVVVVGGGAVGTAIASFLARKGMDVALVERGECPWGSSKRCDGHAVTYDSPPGYFSQFCRMGIEMFPEIIPLLQCDIHFEPEGIGLLVDDENDMETALANFEGKQKEGVPVELWHQDELRRHEPNISDRVLACVNFTGDAKLDPMRLTFALAALAKEHKARLFDHTTVTGIDVVDGQVQAVRTDKGVIATQQVILAAGVWTPGLAYMAGVSVPIRPRQGHILVTEKLTGMIGKNYAEFGYLAAKGGKKRSNVTPDMEQFGVAMVLEPSAHGTILVGSSRRYVGMDIDPDPSVMHAIAQRTVHFFPTFGQSRVIRCYAGLRPATPDGKPIISKTKVKGIVVASGHEGNGIGLSLITGRLVAELLSGETPCVDLTPLRLERFAEAGM